VPQQKSPENMSHMNDNAADNIGRLAARGSVWATGSNLAGRLIAFITTMVMARLLEPADFGLIAIGLICIGMLDAFRNLGVGEALIYRQRSGDTDSNTAFWIALGVGTLLTMLALAMAPVAARFFGNPDAEKVIAVLSVVFVIESLMVIHATRAQRDFQFARRATAEMTKTIFKAVVSISLALLGFGMWSLVAGQITGALAGAICYWIVVQWRPAFEFDRRAAVGLLSYGSVLIALGFVAFGINRADQFMIGRHLNETQLGYYAVAFSMVDLLVANPARTIGQASYSAFSKLSGDLEKLKQNYLDTVLFVSLLCIALGAGMFATSSNFVMSFLSAKWSAAIPVVEALSFFAITHAVSYSAGDVLKALGRARQLVWLSCVALLVSVLVLWFVAPEGIVQVAWTVFIIQFVSGLVMTAMTMHVLKVSAWELLNSLKPALIAGVLMVLVLRFLLPTLTESFTIPVRLIMDVIVGAIVYVGVVRIIRPDVPARILEFVRPKK